MNPGQLYIRHYHSDFTKDYGGRNFTVALRQKPHSGTVDVALAICNPKDQFCKRTGRLLAVERLLGTEPGVGAENRTLTTRQHNALTMDGHIFAAIVASDLPTEQRERLLDACQIESRSGLWRRYNV